ncbi:MAG: hypothetical protein GX555_12410 [Actinomycetales bacterium]|nr:hypothetical protein [Actinomycetales bacterium]
MAGSAVDKLVESFAHAVESALKVVTSAWLSVPSPSPTSSTVTTMQQNLEWVTLLVAAVGMLVAIVRMGVTSNLAEGVGLARMYLAMVVVTGCGGVVVASLIQAGDAAAPWFVERATGAGYSDGTATLITAAMLQGTGQAMGLVMGLIALIASLFQIAFMFVRGALLIVLMAMLPTIAAGTATEAGMLRFKRVCAWIFACVIYKPVAAIIYAIGFLQIKGDPAADLNGLDDVARSTYDLVLGTIIIILAVLALPALIRFVAPVADRVGGSSFSPGAALGSVATGAVVVTGVIATGGAAAPAAGAAAGSGAAGGGTAAMATGAAGSAGAGGQAAGAARGGAGPSGGTGGTGSTGPAGPQGDPGGQGPSGATPGTAPRGSGSPSGASGARIAQGATGAGGSTASRAEHVAGDVSGTDRDDGASGAREGGRS